MQSIFMLYFLCKSRDAWQKLENHCLYFVYGVRNLLGLLNVWLSISGSTGCSGLCPGLFEDVMFYDVFRVCTKDLNPISYCFLNISLIWWRAFTSPLFLYALPLCDTFLPICSVLFCLLLLYFSFPWLLLFATRSNSFSVSGDWQWWDLSQGGASEKKS